MNPTQADSPVRLLRDAVDKLKASSGDLADTDQVAGLLEEARVALERANTIGRALSKCDVSLKERQFGPAFEALDAALQAYPGDAVLLARRQEVERQQKNHQTVTSVRAAIREAKWLLDQNRIDLAVQFLKDKNAELPEQPALISGLEELQDQLPRWEQNRQIQAALERGSTLEQLQQDQAALTILEETLQSYPESTELTEAVQRLRRQVTYHDHKKKLARRVDAIRQKVAAQSWKEAQALLKEAWTESPDSQELTLLQAQTDEGLRRAECEAIVAAVRLSLADGDLEEAEAALRRGHDSLGPEPAFEALGADLAAERRYQEELRTAQIFFGRRQLADAERLLEQLAASRRPEAEALLDAVRKARAAEQEDFCENGRKQAQKLVQKGQYSQAVDLLRNLLSLYPGHPALEEDMGAALRAMERASAAAVAPPPPSHLPPPSHPATQAPPLPVVSSRGASAAAAPALEPLPGAVRREFSFGALVVEVTAAGPSSFRRAAVAGAALLALIAVGAVLKLSTRGSAASKLATPAASQATADRTAAGPQSLPSPQPANAAAVPAPRTPQPSNAAGKRVDARQRSTPLRTFVPPESKEDAPIQTLALPPAPASGAVVTTTASAVPPPEVTQFVNTPPRPPATRTDAAPAPSTPAKSTATGGRFEEAQIVQRTMPAYPTIARQIRAYGTVHLEVNIDEHGQVKNVKVVGGHPVLATAAKEAVAKWKFKAAVLDGKPVASTMAVQVSFSQPH